MSDLASLLFEQLQGERAHAGRVWDAVIGVVTQNKDPEKLFRVQVKLPVFNDDESTYWAPVVSSGAGDKRGWFFLPEVDDEVLVMFDQGDINHPVIVGALWGGKDKAPDKNPDGNKRRVIKSRAGSKITFDDDKGQLIIEDGGGKGRITLDAQNNKVIIEAINGDVALQSPQGDMTIVAQSAEFTANMNVDIKSGTSLSLGATTAMTLGGQSLLQVSAPQIAWSGGGVGPQAPQAQQQDIDEKYGS